MAQDRGIQLFSSENVALRKEGRMLHIVFRRCASRWRSSVCYSFTSV